MKLYSITVLYKDPKNGPKILKNAAVLSHPSTHEGEEDVGESLRASSKKITEKYVSSPIERINAIYRICFINPLLFKKFISYFRDIRPKNDRISEVDY